MVKLHINTVVWSQTEDTRFHLLKKKISLVDFKKDCFLKDSFGQEFENYANVATL